MLRTQEHREKHNISLRDRPPEGTVTTTLRELDSSIVSIRHDDTLSGTAATGGMVTSHPATSSGVISPGEVDRRGVGMPLWQGV